MFASTVLLLEAFVALFGTLRSSASGADEFPPPLVFGVGIGLSLV